MKKMLLSSLSILLLFGYVMQLAPVTLAANEKQQKQAMLVEHLSEVMSKDENDYYRVDEQKVHEYGLNNFISNLEMSVEEENAQEAEITPFSLTAAAVIEALILAGLGWLATQIIDYGMYRACMSYGVTMYNYSISGKYNPASFYFYDYCRSRGW